MSKISKSDYTTGAVTDYGNGIGYYTKHQDVSELLQIGSFNDNTTPTHGAIGRIIKRVEGKIDDKLKVSFRPEIIEKEIHDFDMSRMAAYPVQPWKDYVGFIQLNSEKISKILRLEVWQGDKYVDMASASCIYTPQSTIQSSGYSIKLQVGDTNVWVLTDNVHTGFFDQFGQKTTVLEICAAINEVFPSKTAPFTGATVAKSVPITTGTRNISDFFYACPTEDGTGVYISSKLPSDAGTICKLTETVGGVAQTPINFTDNESGGRTEEFWTLTDEGKLFFRTEYPHNQKHSVRITYIRGSSKVPAAIHEAATKLVAAEVLVTDDNTILIAETGSNIDLAKKHEILTNEANAILEGKRNLVHLID